MPSEQRSNEADIEIDISDAQNSSLLENLDRFQNQIANDPEITRRAFLGISTLGLLGMGAAALKRYSEPVRKFQGLALADKESPLPTTTSTSTTVPPTTTTLPPAPPPVPPPAAPVETAPAPAPVETILSPEAKMEKIKASIGAIPTLDEFAQKFPDNGNFQDLDRKKQHLAHIAANIQVTPEEFNAFEMDSSHLGAFASHPSYGKRFSPRLITLHWTGKMYETVQEMIDSMMAVPGSQKSVQFGVFKVVDGQAKSYKFFDDETRLGAHALGANDLGSGVENWGVVLEDLQPEQIRENVKIIVWHHRKHKLPIDNTTVVSHMAVDLILSDRLNPETKEITSIRKFDFAQELINLIIGEAQRLDTALGPREWNL